MKMKEREDKYGLAQIGGVESPNEVEGDDAAPVGRRTFLKMAGFSMGAATLAGCSRGLERNVVPYLTLPEEVVPGRAYRYATVCGACPAGCGILAKNLDGRPVKLEGNPDHPVSGGGLCPIGQASVLGLYDSARLAAPLTDSQPVAWDGQDLEITGKLETIRKGRGAVRFVVDSCSGPAERASINRFLDSFPDGRLITYDPLSVSAIPDAHLVTHKVRALPVYRFENARVIVSFGADFLGSWISPVEHTAGYRSGRDPKFPEQFSWHAQLESRMTLTGTNADRRWTIEPGSTGQALSQLASRLAGHHGVDDSLPDGALNEIAGRLLAADRGSAVVVCGVNDPETQILVNTINDMLGAYGSVVDLAASSKQRVGDDSAILHLVDELTADGVDAIFFRDVNPVYDLPSGSRIGAALDGPMVTASFASMRDETSTRCRYACPEPHYLEAWGDSEPVNGMVAVRQPVMRPIGKSRPLLETLAAWDRRPASARDILREHWRTRVHTRGRGGLPFDSFWDQTLHDGRADVEPLPVRHDAMDRTAARPPQQPAPRREGSFVLELYPSLAVFDGRHAHNPWLLEMPDPITKSTWENFASLGTEAAARLDVQTGDEVRIEAGEGEALTLPVVVQPGQHPKLVAIALGWGRSGTDRFAKIGPQWLEGKPTVPDGGLVGSAAGSLTSGMEVGIVATGKTRDLACTQIHHSLFVPEKLAIPGHERRPLVRETTLGAHATHAAHHEHPSLWPEHAMEPHHWGMAIDLTACTGCSACVIACQAENNIPVVGRDEVFRAREMHWMRIDRYYGREGDGQNVDVVHMPMMCQHCDNAPCETVCPVQATAQSAEGLNQQVYNRCVGTRYCANNCPYKVRRFNWFDYPREDRLQNMVLNPDVTVRSRGVMEKCSMCVQRIQETKSTVKQEGRPIRDGEIQPACAQTCPAQAITFGDMNDPESQVTHRKNDSRHYLVLDELGIKPVVGYLDVVRNRDEKAEPDEHA